MFEKIKQMIKYTRDGVTYFTHPGCYGGGYNDYGWWEDEIVELKTCDISFEEIPGGLLDNVDKIHAKYIKIITPKNEVKDNLNFKKVVNNHLNYIVHDVDSKQIKNQSYDYTLEYFTEVENDNSIRIYDEGNILIFKNCRREENSGSKKWKKIIHSFTVHFLKQNILNYVQFVCTNTIFFNRKRFYPGDIITVFLKNNNQEYEVIPPIVTYKPDNNVDAFIPLLPSQHLQVISTSNNDIMEFTTSDDKFQFIITKTITEKDIRKQEFICKEKLEKAAEITINRSSGKKKIFIPIFQGNSAIISPRGTSKFELDTSSIDSFLFITKQFTVFNKDLIEQVWTNCPESANIYKSKINVKHKGILVFELKNNNWTVAVK